MNRESQDFVELILQLMPKLIPIYEDEVAFWSPDKPLDTTTLSRLGAAIAESFDCFSNDTIMQCFQLVEVVVARPTDDRLSTVVATGLLEGLSAGMRGRSGLWDRIVPLLGPASRHHIESWR